MLEIKVSVVARWQSLGVVEASSCSLPRLHMAFSLFVHIVFCSYLSPYSALLKDIRHVELGAHPIPV